MLACAEQVHKAEGPQPRPVHPQQVVTADKLSRKGDRKLMGAAQRTNASSSRRASDTLQGSVQETDGVSASFSITNLLSAHRFIVRLDRQYDGLEWNSTPACEYMSHQSMSS